jgi:drug/metabolite transporter (DMT)-like permease
MGIPFIFFGLAMRKTDNPTLINQLTYLSPFMSLFIISIVLGEKIVPTTMIGLALIVFGIIFNEYLAVKKNGKN